MSGGPVPGAADLSRIAAADSPLAVAVAGTQLAVV
jgi:hypothetical protein